MPPKTPSSKAKSDPAVRSGPGGAAGRTKTKTRPGLGVDAALPRMDSAEMKRVRDSFRREEPAPESAETVRPRLRDSVRREDPDDDGTITPAPPRSDHPSSRRTSSWETEPTTGTRRKSGERSHRPPVTVDDVGTAAVRLARSTIRDSAPKVVASRSTIAKAPIDTRAAFVMSLVDGRNSVESLIDMAGMPEEEVRGILARLARLGLISLP